MGSRRGGARRGAAMLWFLIVALPMLVFGAAIAADVTRIIVTARQTSNAAEAAAVAGAQQFQQVKCPGTWWFACTQYSYQLNPSVAQSTATGLITKAQTAKAIRATVLSKSASTSINPAGTQRVQVVVKYRVDGLVFTKLLFALFGKRSPTVSLQTVRTADVCSSTGSTQGYCTRPTFTKPALP